MKETKETLKLSLRTFIILVIIFLLVLIGVIAIIVKHNSKSIDSASISNKNETSSIKVSNEDVEKNEITLKEETEKNIDTNDYTQEKNQIINNDNPDKNQNKDDSSEKEEVTEKTESEEAKEKIESEESTEEKEESSNDVNNSYETEIESNNNESLKEDKTNTFIVTFNSNGGTEVKTQYVEFDKKASKPNIPVKEGFSFVEWQLNGNTFNFNESIKENITLTAVWEEIYYPLLNGEVDINDFRYERGQYIYNTGCNCWSKNVTLEISKSNKENIIKEIYTNSGQIAQIDLPVNRGETAKFYFRMYVTKNGIKEYSEYRTLSVTAPIEEYDKLNLNTPSIETILLDMEGNRVYKKDKAEILRLNLSSKDKIKGYLITKGNGYGIFIDNVSTYELDPTKANPDYFEAYLDGNLYIQSYIKLSNGAYFYSNRKLVK